MAKRRRRSKGSNQYTKRRRSRRRTVASMSFPLRRGRVLLTNPGGMMGMFTTVIASVVGGAAVGFVTSKMLGTQSTGVRAAATLGLGLVGGFLAAKKSPGLANAWMSSTVGSLGYVLGTNAGGGVAASNKADAVAQLARISATGSSTSTTGTGTAGMGLLARRGSMGVLAPARGLGASNAPVSMRRPALAFG